MSRDLAVLGAPSSAGAYAPGQEGAPAAFRRHGIVPSIGSTGRTAVDMGDTPPFRWRPDRDRPDAMNIAGVSSTAAALADKVADALDEGLDALVLGGDCTVELGTVAGALRSSDSVGLVYVDLDVDLKVPATGDGALDWMGLAHLLDAEGAVPELAALAPRRPALRGSDVLPFACDNITESESALIARSGVTSIPLQEVHAGPETAAGRAVAWAERFDRLLVHVDFDVLSWVAFPIAENTRKRDGLALDELEHVLAALVAAPNWRALTLCEVNPDHAPDQAESFMHLVRMLTNVLSPR